MPGLGTARFYPGSASIMMNMLRDVTKITCHTVRNKDKESILYSFCFIDLSIVKPHQSGLGFHFLQSVLLNQKRWLTKEIQEEDGNGLSVKS